MRATSPTDRPPLSWFGPDSAFADSVRSESRSYRSSFGEPHRWVGRLPFWVILINKSAFQKESRSCDLAYLKGRFLQQGLPLRCTFAARDAAGVSPTRTWRCLC
jgi:hypothetical protein